MLIDLHSHILPEYDDGATDMETAIRMLRMAETDGVTAIVATPHFIPGSSVFPLDKARETFERLTDTAREQGIGLAIHLGQEILAEDHLVHALNKGKCLPIAESRFVLMEFPLGEQNPEKQLNHVKAMVAEGWKPVLAHLERYDFIQEDEESIEDFLEQGCFVQLNAGSFTGLFGRQVQKTANRLIELGAAHIIASDAHTERRRSPILSGAYREVQEWYGVKTAEVLFCDNPRNVLDNRSMVNLEPQKRKRNPLLQRLHRFLRIPYGANSQSNEEETLNEPGE